MMRIAVIGSGISGMAAAYYLSRKHEVFVFEKEPRVGGHTHTVTVESSRGPLAVDTGFIVHNDRTYPNLVKLLAELGVGTQPSDMSFAVTCRRTGFEYSSRGLNGFFAQRANLVRLDQYRLLREILRFNREAPKLLQNPAATTMTLGDFIDQGRYTTLFAERYLYPTASAVWSMSMQAIRAFPALTLVRFFENHGLLGIDTHFQWRAIRGGSRSYIPPITAPYKDRIYTSANIRSVTRAEAGITLRFDDRPAMFFDQVVFGCHGNQIPPLLESPTDAEPDILGRFTTSRNEVGDPSLPLREKLQADAAEHGIRLPDGPIFLLTHLRYLGYSFNPISLYYCCNPEGRVDAILAEVNSTFGETHNYWLSAANQVGRPDSRIYRCPKAMHVSPFMPMQLDYRFVLPPPGERLIAHMNTLDGEHSSFDATLRLRREPSSASSLRRALLRFPCVTAKVIAAIHWEALKLYSKRVPVFMHPARSQ